MTNIPLCMSGMRGLIMGVANERSLAWGIAQACHAAGARLILTYQGGALQKRVLPLAERVGAEDCGGLRRVQRGKPRRPLRRGV